MLKPIILMTESEASAFPERRGIDGVKRRKYSLRLLEEADRLGIKLGNITEACRRIGIPRNRVYQHRLRRRIQSGAPRVPYAKKITPEEKQRSCCILALDYYRQRTGWSLKKSFHWAGNTYGINGKNVHHRWAQGFIKL